MKVLATLGIPVGRPVIVLIGWASNLPTSLSDPEAQRDSLHLLMQSVVARVCLDEGAVVVSGGTDAGVMAALGATLAEYAPGVTLVGVAPVGRLIGFGARPNDNMAARPEPHHRLIRVPGDKWSDGGPTLVRVAEQVAQGCGLVVLAIGGNDGTRGELALAARREWPIILLTGATGASEAVANELGLHLQDDPSYLAAAAKRATRSGTRPRTTLPPERRGRLLAVRMSDRPEIERALRWRLGRDDLLREAWRRFSTTEVAAQERKLPTKWLAVCVLALAVLTGFAALGAGLGATNRAGWRSDLGHQPASNLLKGAVTGLPLLAAVLFGVLERRARTGTWVEFRAAAETVLRSIYRFRGGVETSINGKSLPVELQAELQAVDTHSEGRTAVLAPRSWRSDDPWPPETLVTRVPACDNLLGPLSANMYDEARVEDQLHFLARSVRSVERWATLVAVSIFILGGGAAFFVALSWRRGGWGALAAGLTTFAAAAVSWREYSQSDARADTMRSTAAAVHAVRNRWRALPHDQRTSQDELTCFVGDVEDALAAEGREWERAVRQAQRGLFERYRS